MIEPLTLSFEVACPVDHAFRMWTSGIGSWWPPDHTITGRLDSQVVLQGEVGGRIYERDREGREYDWGEVTIWDPPRRLAYLWHLGFERSSATTVEIRFNPRGEATLIEVEHTGWERLGQAAPEARRRNQSGWKTLIPHFTRAVEKGDGQ